MIESSKHPRLVGNFIRQRREALGLSQRALGLLFNPVVTTQFISNVERGVTPLPPVHIPTLIKALLVSEDELMNLLNQEFAAKLSGRLGKPDQVNGLPLAPGAAGNGGAYQLVVAPQDYEFMRRLYDAYRQSDEKARAAFSTVCETLLHAQKKVISE